MTETVRKITGRARPKEWRYRAKFFGNLIAKTEYTHVYDFGCGYCELANYIGGKTYIGMDAIAYTPNVLVYDLSISFPDKLIGNSNERIAVSLGLFEHLVSPLALIQKILSNFDCLYFSYGQKNKRKETTIDEGRFKDYLANLCNTNNRNLRVTKIDNDPLEINNLGIQNAFFITPIGLEETRHGS